MFSKTWSCLLQSIHLYYILKDRERDSLVAYIKPQCMVSIYLKDAFSLWSSQSPGKVLQHRAAFHTRK